MKSEWAKRISQVSVFNVEKVRQKIWRWKLRSDLQLFSTCLWNSRKSPEGPLLRDLGSDKDSLCSAWVFRREPAVSIPPALLACSRVCCVGLAGTWELFPGAHRGLLCAMLPWHPAQTHQLWWLRKGLQGTCKSWDRLQGWIADCGEVRAGSCTAGRAKSCENPALNAPALCRAAR